MKTVQLQVKFWTRDCLKKDNFQIMSLSLYQKWRFLDGKQGPPNMTSTLFPFLKILRQMITLERMMDWHELDSVCEVIIIYWVQLLGSISNTHKSPKYSVNFKIRVALQPSRCLILIGWGAGGESESSDKDFLLTSLNKTIQKPIVLDEENITYCWEKGSKN